MALDPFKSWIVRCKTCTRRWVVYGKLVRRLCPYCGDDAVTVQRVRTKREKRGDLRKN